MVVKKLNPNATKRLFIGYSDNTTAFLLQNTKNMQTFASKTVKFNEPEDIKHSYLYLDLDKIREELWRTDTAETYSVQETENNTNWIWTRY